MSDEQNELHERNRLLERIAALEKENTRLLDLNADLWRQVDAAARERRTLAERVRVLEELLRQTDQHMNRAARFLGAVVSGKEAVTVELADSIATEAEQIAELARVALAGGNP